VAGVSGLGGASSPAVAGAGPNPVCPTLASSGYQGRTDSGIFACRGQNGRGMSRKNLGSDESDTSEVPGYRNYLVYTDETGMHGSTYYGFGTFWVPWERRGDLQRLVNDLKDEHRLVDELKWQKQSKRSEALARALIDEFFKRPWMMFHSIIVNRNLVNHDLHDSRDQAQQKHFSMLLKNKIAYFARGGGKVYRVRVDPLPWRYEKADEVVHKVVNNQLKQELGEPLIHDVIACESKETIGIQIADLLLGAVLAAWQQDTVALHKLRLTQHIANNLGWPDLRHDTRHTEWKFNIWHFHDPVAGGPREARTLPVKLKFPMPAYRPTRRSRLSRT